MEKNKTKSTASADNKAVNLESMTREQLIARVKANVAERKRLTEENKAIWTLYKNATSSSKTEKLLKRKAEIEAQLASIMMEDEAKTATKKTVAKKARSKK